jgi:glutamate synthase domain-containing protein 2
MSLIARFMRRMMTENMQDMWGRMVSDNYTRSDFAMVPLLQKIGIRTLVESNLRATDGEVLDRPLGSPVVLSPWEKLLLNPVHLYQFPLSEKEKIDTSMTIGPMAKRPLKLAVPIMISGMSWGTALSLNMKVSLAKAASMVGTATNTGESPVQKEEREAAKLLIGQYTRGGKNTKPDELKQLDAIEIQLGQGAQAAAPVFQPSRFIGEDIRDISNSPEGKPSKAPTRLKGVNNLQDFSKTVTDLKQYGVPVGVKFAATDYIEHELKIMVDAGVDYVVVDGAEAGTHGGPTILQDDMGLPTLIALARTSNYLEDLGVRNRVSIIAGGGLTTPGHFLKAKALGADAVYIGTIALIALLHTQMTKALPLEPPMQIALYTGVFKEELDVDKGAENLANFIHSCQEEMRMACYAMGKSSIFAVNRADLTSVDRHLAELCRIRWAYRSIFEPAEHLLERDLPLDQGMINEQGEQYLQ